MNTKFVWFCRINAAIAFALAILMYTEVISSSKEVTAMLLITIATMFLNIEEHKAK